VIEEAGEGKSPPVQSRPIQIAEHGSSVRQGLDFSRQGELFPGGFPGGTVKNQPIHPGPKLFVEGFAEFRLRPEAKREVGLQVRENDIREGRSAFSIETEGDLFRANLASAFAGQVAVGADPGFGSGGFSTGIGQDQDRAERMLAGNGGNEVRVGIHRPGILGIDNEIDQGSPGFGVTAGLPEFPEFFVDTADFDRQSGLVHRRLHEAPWRLISSSASEGPQLPEE